MRVLCASAAVLAAVYAGGAAAGPGEQADALRRQNADLAGRARAALLDLYALDSRLARAHARLGALETQAAALAQEQAQVRLQVRIARHALVVSQRRLGARLRDLYMEPDPDPVAIVLAASSLDEAMTGLDDLSRAAGQNQRTIAQTTKARIVLGRLAAGLARRAAAVESLRVEARETAAALERARSERQAFLAGLARRRQLNADRIAGLTLAARAAVARSTAVARSAAPAPTPAAAFEPAADATPPASPGQTLTVSATGYALAGETASGLPVGWGVVAVDPSVIPLGTRLTIPGYGEGVAADTGSAVQGLAIDLWFPSAAQAFAWGRRTVTITLH
jgi:3D (Asp-Asp-Asp) domain-containing protein